MVKRPINEMPTEIIRQLLIDERLMADYEDRPPYQRNDYLRWIGRARRPETRRKRIDHMLDELRAGGVYMKMEHTPSSKA